MFVNDQSKFHQKLSIVLVPGEQRVRQVRWDTDLAARLVQLEGVRSDLQDAEDLLARIVKTAPTADYLMLDALATAAIVRYARCFRSGRRGTVESLVEWPENISNNPLHQRVLAIRDKHVAHAVNEFETNSVYLWLRGEDSACITALTTGTRSAVAISSDEASELARLSRAGIEVLTQAIFVEQKNLIQRARELSEETILALPRGPRELDPDPLQRRKYHQT